MNHIRALIMIKRKMTPATTAMTSIVEFERRTGVAFGRKSKYSKQKA
jgi:hypothetical protein